MELRTERIRRKTYSCRTYGTKISITSVAACENGGMLSFGARLKSPWIQGAAIAVLVVALAIFTWIVPPHAVVLHNILHHLNILPFMLAGLRFGWRGALKAAFLATVLQAPSIHRHWYRMPLDAQDQIIELTTFGSAGVIAGMLADRERLQRRRVEATKVELESVDAELRSNIEQMKKIERLTAAGELAASLAHEIRNPLASISGAAGILARGQAPNENRQECLDILMRESHRLNKLLTNFLDFARPRLPRFQRTEPVSVIHSVMTLARHSAVLQDVKLEHDMPDHLHETELDAEQIKQVLLNLILNAVQATQGSGTVQVRSFVTNDRFCFEVKDQGCGIPPENLERIFDPFFTTKDNGTGLGLAVVANIVAQHGGTLTCTSYPKQETGTTFRVELPLEQPRTASVKIPQQTAISL